MRALIAIVVGGCGFSGPGANGLGNHDARGGDDAPLTTDGPVADGSLTDATGVDGATNGGDAPSQVCFGHNGFAVCIPPPTSAVSYTGNKAIDTTSGDCTYIRNSVCIVAGTTIDIASSANVTISGANPIVFASFGLITMGGTITVAPGTGGNSGCNAPGGASADNGGAGGGAGGSDGSTGGNGGSGHQGMTGGGTRGSALGIATSLRGGCGGGKGGEGQPVSGGIGGGGGGLGGGALGIYSNGAIQISAYIVVSGSPGGLGKHAKCGGGGGGSGGLIVIDGSSVAVSGILYANGGGGGGGAGPSVDGARGSTTAPGATSGTPAAGGSGGDSSAGPGASGAAGGTTASPGVAAGFGGNGGDSGGGGGGGGLGQILVTPINTVDGVHASPDPL